MTRRLIRHVTKCLVSGHGKHVILLKVASVKSEHHISKERVLYHTPNIAMGYRFANSYHNARLLDLDSAPEQIKLDHSLGDWYCTCMSLPVYHIQSH
jgi:hypothetical protein